MEPKKPVTRGRLGERLFDLIEDLDTPQAASGRPQPSADRQIAVAISHEPGAEKAPVVVAQGYGAVAEKILRLAFDHDVKVRRDPDLAQVLMAVEMDQEIPVEAFAAVAEILSYVYRANARIATEGEPAHEDDEPNTLNAWTQGAS
ncbi:EscU/YscU/HrcU family type III secretion system export apparatus switch protein [Oceanibaculum pacificum]|uniref:EscU/YscU/HrcU family type III secretion system export apparatus switch protein n=1 Tax=Oceanibaculum pacificum TaxID=580166 RepID=UPI000A00D843|nr:EscU/YscU/HrcU family type III secretion system export apparatus switch protein [Oceanibaculum pacificum]